MAEIKYTEEQIIELLRNKYVKSCTNKNITFTKECKLKSVELWNNGLTTKEIFQKLGFPEYVTKSEIPSRSINRWKRNVENGNIETKRGRKQGFKSNKKINLKNLSDKEKIEYLEIENAYLKELYKEKHGFYP